MDESFSEKEISFIRSKLGSRYKEVSEGPEGLFQYPVGEEGLSTLGYPKEVIESLPQAVRSGFCGVGNPFSLGTLEHGSKVLDLGCGVGVDSLVASTMVGPRGQVIGIDVSEHMLNRAEENRLRSGGGNLRFVLSDVESIPLEDRSVDVIITNGVLNLVVDKRRVLEECFRVLDDGGEMWIADQVLTDDGPLPHKDRVRQWAG